MFIMGKKRNVTNKVKKVRINLRKVKDNIKQ